MNMVCCVIFSSNVAVEQLVLRSLKASPLIKPFLTPGGWQKVKCGYWSVIDISFPSERG